MKKLIKWISLTALTLLIQSLILIFTGIKTNLFFLLIFLFIVDYYFPKEQKKNISPHEVYPLIFFAFIGFIEDLGQEIIGPSIISKSITGYLLIKITNQFFFTWSPPFKGIIIFIFTLLDEFISMVIVMSFFNLDFEHFVLLKEIFIRALINVPLGLFISWGRP